MKIINATELLRKSHVKSYTRQDGTAVQEHEDSRQARDMTKKANSASRQARSSGSVEDHMAAAQAHKEAMRSHKEAWHAHKGEETNDHFPEMHNHIAQAHKHLAAAGKSPDERKDFLQKSHVKSYTRTTASGGSVQVREHEDSRRAMARHEALSEYRKGYQQAKLDHDNRPGSDTRSKHYGAGRDAGMDKTATPGGARSAWNAHREKHSYENSEGKRVPMMDSVQGEAEYTDGYHASLHERDNANPHYNAGYGHGQMHAQEGKHKAIGGWGEGWEKHAAENFGDGEKSPTKKAHPKAEYNEDFFEARRLASAASKQADKTNAPEDHKKAANAHTATADTIINHPVEVVHRRLAKWHNDQAKTLGGLKKSYSQQLRDLAKAIRGEL